MEPNWSPENCIPWVLASLAILIVYYVFLVRMILQMLRAKSNQVMLVFAFLAIFPVPPALIMGIVVMIIWALHKNR